MKIAICNETFGEWPFARAFQFARELGYEGIEIAPFTMAASAFDITPEMCRQTRELAATNQLEIVGLHWLLAGTRGLHLTSPEASVRQQTANYLSRLAEICHELGGKIMVFGSPQQRNLLSGVTLEVAHQWAADCLDRLVPVLQENDVFLALEPLGPEEGDFLQTAAETRQLVDTIDSPFVKLLLDVKAMSTEPTPIPEIIRGSAHSLVHFHCNDPNRRGPGMGDVDYRPILAALRDAGYDGWLSVEVFDTSVSPEALAAQSIQYLRQLLVNA